jgi:hypothetical protein
MYAPSLKSPLLNTISAALHMRKSSLVSDTRGSWQFRNYDMLSFRHTNNSILDRIVPKVWKSYRRKNRVLDYSEPKNVQLCDTLTRGRDLKTRLWDLSFLRVTSSFSLYLFFVLDLTVLCHSIAIEDTMKPTDYRCLWMYISINIQ